MIFFGDEFLFIWVVYCFVIDIKNYDLNYDFVIFDFLELMINFWWDFVKFVVYVV